MSLCTASPSPRYGSAAKLEPTWPDEWHSATPGPKPFARCGATSQTRSTNDYAWIPASNSPRPKQRPLDIGVSIARVNDVTGPLLDQAGRTGLVLSHSTPRLSVVPAAPPAAALSPHVAEDQADSLERVVGTRAEVGQEATWCGAC